MTKKKTKMTEITLGTFYGFDLYMKMPADGVTAMTEQYFKDRFSEWRKDERKNAVEEYKSQLFLMELKKARPLFRFLNIFKRAKK